MKLLIDVDGVLADFVGGVRRTLNLPADWAPTRFELQQDPLVGPRWKELCAAIAEPGWCLGLHEFADTYADLCFKLITNGHEVQFVTSPWKSSPHWVAERTEWLQAFFGPDARVVFTSEKHLVKGDWLIDDKPEHVDAFRATYRPASLVAASYNQHRQDAESFSDIVRQINEHERNRRSAL